MINAPDSLQQRHEKTHPGYVRSEGAPDNEIAVLVVNECWNTAAGIDCGVLRGLVLVLAEVEVDEFVVQSELLKNNNRLPVGGLQRGIGCNAYGLGSPSVGRKSGNTIQCEVDVIGGHAVETGCCMSDDRCTTQ